MRTFSIANHTRGTLPRIPFQRLKDRVLGPDYELSVALLPPSQARQITRQTKHTDKASNVLAFPLSKRSGEILLCPATARAQASSYGKTPRVFLAYLFIHGLLHLKGYAHSARMEKAEDRILKEFDLA